MVYLLIMRGLCLFLLFVYASGCSSIRPGSSPESILFEIDSIPIYSDEFLYNFKKNLTNSDSVITRNDIDEYLDLFINFKLKVKEATEQGIDTTQAFLEEYNKYKDQLTESYLKNDSIITALVREAYDRMQIELNVSHIIMRIQNEYDSVDTRKAFEKITSIKRKLDSGADFQELAISYSEDPSVKLNHGNLGYFTVLQMVYPFETVAYNTPVGQYSNPFKTSFGYHILKVNDIRPAQGKVQVAHIMLRFPENATSTDSVKVRNKIIQIYDSLKNGGDWDTLCRLYSEDRNTNNIAGVLQPFEAGRVIPAFSEAAFRLKEINEISEPVLTPYGWHIIKLINKIPIKPYEEIKDELTERVRRDSRSELAHTYLIEKLKKENNFQMIDWVKDTCLKMAKNILLSKNLTTDSSLDFLNAPLFTLQRDSFPAKDFLDYAYLKRNNSQHLPLNTYLRELMNDFIEGKLIEYERAHLKEKNYDYKMLVREYHEGILLFDLMDQEVWNKAIKDTLGLKSYFEENNEKYKWKERLNAMIFSSSSTEEIDKLRHLLAQPFYTVFEDTLKIILSEEKFLDDVSYSRIDSLCEWASKDSSQFVEMTCNAKIKELLLSTRLINDEMAEKIIFKDTTTGDIYLKIITSSKKSIEKLINRNSDLNLRIESGYFEKGDNEIIDMIDWKPGMYDLSIENTEYLVYVEKVIPPVEKDLSEVRGQVISDYQNYLEKEWIKKLKSKYSVNINNDALSQIYNEFRVH